MERRLPVPDRMSANWSIVLVPECYHFDVKVILLAKVPWRSRGRH